MQTMKQTTRTHILKSCLALSAKEGYRTITREQIATHADVPPSLVSYHLGTMIELRRHVMREAIHTENLAVLAQGLIIKDKHALKAPAEMRSSAIDAMRV